MTGERARQPVGFVQVSGDREGPDSQKHRCSGSRIQCSQIAPGTLARPSRTVEGQSDQGSSLVPLSRQAWRSAFIEPDGMQIGKDVPAGEHCPWEHEWFLLKRKRVVVRMGLVQPCLHVEFHVEFLWIVVNNNELIRLFFSSAISRDQSRSELLRVRGSSVTLRV